MFFMQASYCNLFYSKTRRTLQQTLNSCSKKLVILVDSNLKSQNEKFDQFKLLELDWTCIKNNRFCILVTNTKQLAKFESVLPKFEVQKLFLLHILLNGQSLSPSRSHPRPLFKIRACPKYGQRTATSFCVCDWSRDFKFLSMLAVFLPKSFFGQFFLR